MSFGSDVRNFTDNAVKKLDKDYRTAIFDLTSAIILDTPVLKGVLRNSWFVTFEPNDPNITTFGAPTGQATINRARQVIKDIQVQEVVYIVNNQKYASRIEYEGHSAQAPAGMVRINTARWDQIVTNVSRGS